jgi:hypothetical protein
MSKDWIFLSKRGQDQYINMFATGSGCEPFNSDLFDYHYDVVVDQRPLVLRGILKHKIMHQCLADGNTFYYMDSGYLGNQRSTRNPQGNKTYHRIVKNDLQHGAVISRPGDRLEKLGLRLHNRRHGRRIIVAVPDEKPCRYYGVGRDQWITSTVQSLKNHTDRPIVIRERAAKRIDRVQRDPLEKLLCDDVHALVTFNSIAAVESIMLGVPAVVLAPTHAAAPVASTRIEDIENPVWCDSETRYAWASHLAYGQYSVTELKNGTAFRMLNEY